MIRSLRTGVAGLKSHQVRMDVTGNNIANVNTTAYKRGRATFNEMLGQQLLGVGRTAGGSGVNPSSIGLGVGVNSISNDWAQGSLEQTNIAHDLALNGDGFFIVRSGDRNMLTRAGNFTFGSDGNLVTNDGLPVQGYGYDANGDVDMSHLQDIKINWASQAPPKATENVTVGGNMNPDSEEGKKVQISSVVHDEQGKPHNAVIEYTKSATPNEWDYVVKYGGDLVPPPFDNLSGTLSFDIDGTLISPTEHTLTWAPEYVSGGETITIDLQNVTQFEGSSTATVRNQDGFASGQLIGYSIDPRGILVLNYSNGEQEELFQLGIGGITNPNGLEQLGENFYGVTQASGDLILGRAGREVQTAVVSGALEQSNVDLATEFTEMIIAQRGYQASARVITTSDELLQETVNLKR